MKKEQVPQGTQKYQLWNVFEINSPKKQSKQRKSTTEIRPTH